MTEKLILDILFELQILVYQSNEWKYYSKEFRVNHEKVRLLYFSEEAAVFGVRTKKLNFTVTFPLIKPKNEDLAYDYSKKILTQLIEETDKFEPAYFVAKKDKIELLSCFVTDMGYSSMKEKEYFPKLFSSKVSNFELFCNQNGLDIVCEREGTIPKKINFPIPSNVTDLTPYSQYLKDVLYFYNLC